MVNSLLTRPSVGELMDRLAVDQIKQLRRPADAAAFEAEISGIVHDLNLHLESGALTFDARCLRRAIGLAQMNWHIWWTKDRMQDSEREPNMKLAHQLNGLRNQLKNAFSNRPAQIQAAELKTNIGVDGLPGWTVSILSPSPSETDSMRTDDRAFRTAADVAETIDAIAIAQIKETFFAGPAVAEQSRRLAELTRDLQIHLDREPPANPSRVIRLSILLAQLHGIIWLNKDRMLTDEAKYIYLLNEAQDLNGLRNACRNQLLHEFGQLTPVTERVTFLERKPGSWYADLLALVEAKGDPVLPYAPVTTADLEAVFGLSPADDRLAGATELSRDLGYRTLGKSERDELILQVVKAIDANRFWVSGKDQQGKWEDGWSENLRRFEETRDLAALVPKFLKKRKIFRFKREFIEARDGDFEFNLIDIYRQRVFRQYFSDAAAIFEFGCGSGQHLPALVRGFPGKTIGGMDWADSSLKIIEALNRTFGWNLQGRKFNMFEPDANLALPPGSAILTVGAMEQLGDAYQAFLDYLLTQSPAVVVHLETFEELYERDCLMDHLAVTYDEKRNYLRGYLTALRGLEAQQRVKILEARRAYFGSMYHDSYSLVAWRPKSATTAPTPS